MKMAARGSAAVRQLSRCFDTLSPVESLLDSTSLSTKKYSREELLRIGMRYGETNSSRSFNDNIPPEIARPANSPWFTIPGTKQRRRRRRKRGCRAGVKARLRRDPNRPALPSIFLTNARSLNNKFDELSATIEAQKTLRDSSIVVVTETWLHSGIADEAITLTGRTAHRADRTSDSGKSRGGGLVIYSNNRWCTNATVTETHCSPDVEFITLRCRPFYLAREHTVVMVTAVYTPPSANANVALKTLLAAVSKQQSSHPDGIFIVTGDFNHVDLRTVLPKFYQHVTCATRGHNVLDKAYSNIKDAYKVSPLPHLGQSDHLSLFLTPAYRPLIQRTLPEVRPIRIWSENAIPQLRDCFGTTNWDIFAQEDLTTYTSTVLFYIKTCMDNVTEEKMVRHYPNRKQWMNSEVKQLLRDRDSAFRSGDMELYSSARSNLKRGIKRAKAAYARKIEGHFAEGNPRRVWQGIRDLINMNSSSVPTTSTSTDLAEELNQFFARFEVGEEEDAPTLLPADTLALTVSTEEVRRVLRGVNPSKAAGPDGVQGRVLRGCADQLAEVFTTIFNLSLAACTVPSCLKSATIVPIPKKQSISSLNDYRPVALTSTVMKCFERLVLRHIQSLLPPSLDQHQFAYRANRSTGDAINTALHTVCEHLEHSGSYARMLFVDFSSAFNTLVPSRLMSKLRSLGIGEHTCRWIRDFLTDRLQSVRLGDHHSSTLTVSTGAPQGCVLSPMLYTLYTHDCAPIHSSNIFVKFADDTTVVGLIHNNDESAYREEVLNLTTWCSLNNLALNSSKTKELVLDFRRKREDPPPLLIRGDLVERVSDFRFLGTYLSQDLTWGTNTNALVKKAQQRLYFLRSLRKVNVSQDLLLSFYRCSVESILTHNILVWFRSSSQADKKALERVRKSAQSIIGVQLSSLSDIYNTRCLHRATSITCDSSHPGHSLFSLLPSGKRYRSIKARTSRFLSTFYLSAIRVLNTIGQQ